MRILLDDVGGRAPGAAVDRAELAALYEPPRLPWLRANMVATVDGAATGPDGVTGSINNPVDKAVFDTLRGRADAILVGAGTAREEGYAEVEQPTVVVSRRGDVPERLRSARPGSVLLATCSSAPGLQEATGILGDSNVIVAGSVEVELAAVVSDLVSRGLREILTEGGPRLLTDLFAAGLVDELCMTTVPRLLGGGLPGITAGSRIDVPLRPGVLVEEDGTVLGRWFVGPAQQSAQP